MQPFAYDHLPTNVPGGFFVYHATGSEEICFADENVLAIYGCASTEELLELTNGSFRGMILPEDLDRVEDEIYAQTFGCGERHDYVHYRIRTKQGTIKYVEDFGHLVHNDDGDCFFYVFIDDVEEFEYRKISPTDWEARVGYRRTEYLNALTGLRYEKAFYSACEQNLANVTINWLVFAIDLQHFKLFNEWYGREAGDDVLSAVGHTIGKIADAHDGVAGYFGGDDFALLVPADRFDADELFERVHEAVTRHGASIGFLPAIGASYSRGSVSAFTLYDQASLACQEAKTDQESRVRFFSQAMVSKAEEDYSVLSEFKNALANGEITFFLQPQCRSENGRIVGAEALARWIKPDGRVVPPLSFIPTLERHGFIPDLDRYVWEQVCRWSRDALDKGLPLIPISVNISPVDIFTMDVPAFFEELVTTYQLPKQAIKLEITESAYSEGSDKVRSTVQRLRDLGFVVLMDDFGSGFSSLNMLRELNVDVIKLDAFFMHMDKNNERKGMHIIESVVNMAKTMAMPIIVEGVETKEQRDYLLGLGIRYIQGYYFYKPMSIADFEGLFASDDMVDPDGFVFTANDEFRIREFLNDTVYTDSMLNHIIGPAAIYSVHGKDVDIVRFNQMFYRAVNVPDFSEKLLGIQNTMPKHEVPELFQTLRKAYDDRLNGGSGVFTFKKIDGSAARFLIHFYFLNEDEDSVRYYGSARDVTEITNIQRHMQLLSRFTSRTILFLLYNHGVYSFDVTAHGLEKDLGISKEQLLRELNANMFYKRMVPASDRTLWNVAQHCAETKESTTAALKIRGDNGRLLDVIVDADYVDDELGDVRCILSLRKQQ
ncbi:MAG: GGDEF and EAL domain-containing protein [Atopobiaceae bacterium]|nr:GGDEF and EAL domain-containing protein [Atopobiaceae bacterium]